MQVDRRQNSAQKNIEGNRKYKEKESEVENIKRQAVRGYRNSSEIMASREKGFYEKRSRKDW
jgi:hypothetical protein